MSNESTSGPHRILVIDDNVAIHEDFRKILARPPNPSEKQMAAMESLLFGQSTVPATAAEFIVDCASQGREGHERVLRALAEGHPYALAFVDGRMPPGWDGVETIRHLWDASPDLQVVLATAYADYSWPDIQRQLGHTDSLLILKKPFDHVEVLQLAHALTRKWELDRQVRARIETLDAQVREKTQALRESEALLARSQQIAHLGSWRLDLETRRLSWSDEAYRIFGLTPQHLPASFETLLETVHPDDRPVLAREFTHSLRAGLDRCELEHRIVRRDSGETRHVHHLFVHERNASGMHVRSVGNLQDITERKLLNEALKVLSGDLAGLSGGEFFRAVCRHLTDALGMDCAFVARLDAQEGLLRVVDGWSGDQPLAPFAYHLAGTPCADVMKRGKEIFPSDVCTLFPEDELVVQMGIESYIGCSLFDKQGQPMGIIAVQGRQPLSTGLASMAGPMLDVFIDRVASEMIRFDTELRMHFQLDFQGIAAEVSSALIAANTDIEFDAAIDRCLGRLGILFKVDRSYVFQLFDDQTRMRNTHEWCEAGIPSEKGNLLDVRLEDVPWWSTRMPREGYVHIPRVSELPPDAEAERATLLAQGIQSLVMTAINGAHGKLIGFIGLDSVRAIRAWSPEEISLLGVVAGIIGAAIERKLAEEKLQQAASVFDHANEGITITNPDGVILDVNEAFSRITGYSREEVLGRTPRILRSGRHEPGFYAAMWQSLGTHGHWTGEIWNRRKSGDVYPEMLTISAVRGPDGAVQRYVALFSDISKIKEDQRKLERIAHYDALTGLPNRSLLGDRLQQAMAQAVRRNERLAVVYLDLDGFKAINDDYGHDAGDRLLTAASARMKHALREGDTLARLGGDEFVAVLIDLVDAESCLPLLNRLLAAAAEPLPDGAHVLKVSASLGVSFYPQVEPIDAEQLLRQADQAMYQAKQTGKNRYHLFDAERDRDLRGLHESLERIRAALAKREFVLHYQPKVDMKRGRVVGVEALIRWQHPLRGLLCPAEFLPLLDNHPLMISLGEWVIEEALTQVIAWRRADLTLPVSINIDAQQFVQNDFIDKMRDALARYPDYQPGDLELEIVETGALQDLAETAQTMRTGQALGIRFSLDDFGTGYSSLTYLKRLPAQVLKIDQSFVRDMLDDPDDLAILEGVIGLGAAFRRQVIAEGVETVAHGEMLLLLGCELGQGYAIAHPMPAAQIPAWLTQWQPSAQWTDTAPVARGNLPVLFALVEHRAWVNALNRYLLGESSTLPPLAGDHCRFGQWLDDVASREDSSDSALTRIQQLHASIHYKAVELVGLKQHEISDPGQSRIGEIGLLREALIKELRGFLTKY